ncbi:MAG: ABC transporter ATP-binding protein, partial [Lachnospiraceae bacterium]|nr:ABC transporter ATP-binding protein [Lachnospiraceae bacterium]
MSIHVNNDIQASVFDQIVDADWLELSKYANGDLLNRFNNDISTVSSNAVIWLPNIIVAVYNFIATFCVIFYYDSTMAW